jgi:iron complex outermembrane receptor protein
LSPELAFPLASGGSVTFRVDYAYRDEMWGEPSSDPGRMTKIEDRGLLNANIAWRNADEDLMIALYGRNITDERYTNAMLNVTDYILQIMSNDASEFGVSFVKEF